MNHNFSIKIAAVLAAFSGTTLVSQSVLPADWLSSASAQPPIVSPQQTQPASRSSMLAPISTKPTRSAGSMPWKVDGAKYQAAIEPPKTNRSALVKTSAVSTPPVVSAKAVNVAPPSTSPAADAVYRQAAVEPGDAAGSSVQPAAAQLAVPMTGQTPNGFSSAGVPLYAPNSNADRHTSNATQPPRQARLTQPQGSGSRNAIGSGVQAMPAIIQPPTASGMDTPFDNQLMAPTSQPAAPMITPGSEMIMGSSGDSVLADPEMMAPGVITDGTVMSDAAPMMIDAGVAGDSAYVESDCSTCNTSGAMGCESCGSCNCGPGGCYDANAIANNAGLYGSVGEARYYTHLEGLLFDRRGGDIGLSTSGGVGDFDADGGWRLTLGERFDAINGREVSYMGILPLSDANDSTGSFRPVRSNFVLGGTLGITGADLRPFGFIDNSGANVTAVNATQHSQLAETYFHSLELNRVRWGWDVFKSFVGLRYIHVNDDYQLTSFNGNPVANPTSPLLPPVQLADQAGQYRKKTFNNLIGPHIGAEWFYDVGYRWSLSAGLKGGIYANPNHVDTRLFRGTLDSNGGFVNTRPLIDASSSQTSFASSLEGSLIAHYQIAPRGRFRIGYNILHLEDVATVSQNVAIDQFGLPANGIGSASDSDRMTFQGLSFGLEIFR